MRYAAMIFACAAHFAAAQSVTSEFVPVRAPGNVFEPILEAFGRNNHKTGNGIPEIALKTGI